MHPSRRHWGEYCQNVTPGYRRRYRRSLVFRLLIVLLAAGCLINAVVGGFYRFIFFRQTHAALESNVLHYAHFLAGEIGSPPDTAKAKAMANRYSLLIRYDGPEGRFEFSPGVTGDGKTGADGAPKAADAPVSGHSSAAYSRAFPDWAEAGTGSKGSSAGSGGAMERAGWHRGRFFVQIQEQHARYLFAADAGPIAYGHGEYLAALILILSLVLFGAFMAIRRALNPLKALTDAVERMGRGELGHQVAVCGRDELGGLASAFNAMSSRLAEMVRGREQLLLDVSHELRSPLTRIKVALEMAPQGTVTESIRDDLREMEAMISELLEAARLDSEPGKLALEDVDIGALVAGAVADHAGASEAAGARLITRTEGVFIKADRARMRKVLANVLDNAVKFSQGRGRPVEVRMEAAIHPGPIGQRDARAGEAADGSNPEVTVAIRDYGPGIPAEELPRLFEPFYRVDRSRSRETGGYGLGLSLCKRIMEAHGGSIRIESKVGEGTEVILILPSV